MDTKMKNIRTSMSLDRATIERLSRAAEATGHSRSALVRDAVKLVYGGEDWLLSAIITKANLDGV